MFNRRVICELPNPFPWQTGIKLYKVKVFREWRAGSIRLTATDVSLIGEEHPRFKQIAKYIRRRSKHV